MLIDLTALAAVLVVGGLLYLHLPKFGAYPIGERLARIERSPNYDAPAGEFRNLVSTRVLVGDTGPISIISRSLLERPVNLRPTAPLSPVATDLGALDPNRDAIAWLGHSSFFATFGGKRNLVDPVFETSASPVPGTNRAFDGTSVVRVENLPAIDLVLITHDHWDHLDHPSLDALRSRVGLVVVPLGVGAHLERWGYAPDRIVEADWFDVPVDEDGLRIHLVPARHFSGRLLTRNKTLWGGYVLESPTHRVLLSGDTGYGPHFREIGRRFGSFDLVALDMGQYDSRWPSVHMTPEDAARAAEDVEARALMPQHVGRFALARHAWTEPFDRIVAAGSDRASFRLITPEIGEVVRLDAPLPTSRPWWRTALPQTR